MSEYLRNRRTWDHLRVRRGILIDLVNERRRQIEKYGFNEELEDGTGPRVRWLLPYLSTPAVSIEKVLRRNYEDHEHRTGKPTWMHLVREEIAEAFQEKDPDRLEEELLQVATLCVSWIETLRLRKEEQK